MILFNTDTNQPTTLQEINKEHGTAFTDFGCNSEGEPIVWAKGHQPVRLDDYTDCIECLINPRVWE